MNIGQQIITKLNGKIVKGKIIKFYDEEIEILLEGDIVIRRSYWEINKIPINYEIK